MINVTTLAPVLREQYFHTFKIVADMMHGDADADTEEVVYIDANDLGKFERMVRGLEFAMSDAYPEYESSEQRAALKKFYWPDKTAYNEYCDAFLVHDCTDGSYDTFACLTDFTVTYFDNDGVERNIEYTLEGEQHVV